MTWHINGDGNSIIQEVLKVYEKHAGEYFLVIYTEDDTFDIFNDDELIIGSEFLILRREHDDGRMWTHIINIHKIESIEFRETEVKETEED